MTTALRTHLRQRFGDGQLVDSPGCLTLRPHSLDALAAMLGEASREGWSVAVAGSGSWQSADEEADVVITTTALDTLGHCHTEDLHLTVGAGVPWHRLQPHAAESGVCVMLDPPGAPGRTIGSIVATGTTGGLQHAFGAVRDQVLGLTVVTGAGEILRTGGTTVKNVAGFDLMKLHVGGFGRYGVVAAGTLRLRALPSVDRTVHCPVNPADLWAARNELGVVLREAAAADLVMAADGSATMQVRWCGAEAVVSAHHDALCQVLPGPWSAVTAPSQRDRGGPVTFRLGVLPSQQSVVCDLIGARLPGGTMVLGIDSGLLRWQGSATPDVLHALRTDLADRAIPLTIERAPVDFLRRVGRFAAPAAGLVPLLAHLRRTFDPAGILRADSHMAPTA